MDKFLTGLGMGNFSFFSSSSAGAKGDDVAKVKNPLEEMNDIPEPMKEDTQVPNRPAKVRHQVIYSSIFR